MNIILLETNYRSLCERDLEDDTVHSLSTAYHRRIVKEAICLFVSIKIGLKYKNMEIYTDKFNAFITIKLEYESSVWSTHFKKLGDLKEKAQQRTIKMVAQIKLQRKDSSNKFANTGRKKKEGGDMVTEFKFLYQKLKMSNE